MKLSARLRAAAELVAIRTTAADVGTDHGYVPVWLCQQEHVQRAIAMDLREGPLERARQHIREAGMDDRIETRISDGLSALCPGEADSAVITGMGGILISRILRQSPETAASLQELVLGPQSDSALVRRTLEELRFQIDREVMLKEDGKYYVLIHAVPWNTPDACREGQPGEVTGPAVRMTEEEAAFGPCLLEKRDPVLLEYLQKRHRTVCTILKRLEGRDGEAQTRRREMEEEMRLIRAAENRYEL